jgi:hypothetical protein
MIDSSFQTLHRISSDAHNTAQQYETAATKSAAEANVHSFRVTTIPNRPKQSRSDTQFNGTTQAKAPNLDARSRSAPTTRKPQNHVTPRSAARNGSTLTTRHHVTLGEKEGG